MFEKLLLYCLPKQSSDTGAPVVAVIMGSDSDLPVMKAAAEVLESFGVPYEVRTYLFRSSVAEVASLVRIFHLISISLLEVCFSSDHHHYDLLYVQLTVVSAHRTPDRMVEYARAAEARGFKVIIAGAGGAAHLPGMFDVKCKCPDVKRLGLVVVVLCSCIHHQYMYPSICRRYGSCPDTTTSDWSASKNVFNGWTGFFIFNSASKRVLFENFCYRCKGFIKFDDLHVILQMPRGVPVATVAIQNASNAGLLAVRMLGSHDASLRDRFALLIS